MNRAEIIERTANGLRRMNIKPSAFVITDPDFWGEETILGFPVYDQQLLRNPVDTVWHCRIVPIFQVGSTKPQIRATKQFYQGYDDAEVIFK